MYVVSYKPAPYIDKFMRLRDDVRTVDFSGRLKQADQGFGWIYLDLTFGEETARVVFSNVVDDPLPNLLDWLKVIDEGDLPTGVEIDDERTIVRWECRAAGQDRLLVSVIDELKFDQQAAAVVDRRVFLTSLRLEYTRFVREELLVLDWFDDSPVPDPSVYREKILSHPFLNPQGPDART